MKYYLIAGEASGDLHGANLMRGLLKSDPSATFRFWGGDMMADVGGAENLARHYKTTSFFGFLEVAKNLPTILRQLKECRNDVAAYQPDVLILIDYPGFNFKMAKFAHGIGLRTFYYISPKVWAWKESRVKLIRKYVDQLFVIFPFETEYFAQRGIKAIYEGNPLVDAVEQRMEAMPTREEFIEIWNLDANKPIIALLAGSRTTEVRYNLPFMVELSRKFTDYQFVIGGVSWLPRELYDEILNGSDVRYICDDTYPLLANAEAALVTSGTATLETALIGTPEIVCYSAGKVSMWIGRMVLKIKYISLVNLIMDRAVVCELIQWFMTQENAQRELSAILKGGEKREKMFEDYQLLRDRVGGSGASDRFAAHMVELLKK